MYDFIYDAIIATKYFGIAALMAVFPSESVMPFVGYRASAGDLSLITAIIAGTIGSTLGSTLLYLLARHFPHKSVASFNTKYGKLLGLTPARVEKASQMFNQHARATIFWGRFIPGVRSAVSLPAGYQGMGFFTFIFYTALGTSVCATLLALLGYYATASISNVQSMATVYTYVFAAIILSVLTLTILYRRKK
ncbi:DedA family protein [soil metagenome]